MGYVYGESVLDDTKTELVTLLTNLMTEMSGSTDPNFNSVIPQHTAVITDLNAVSIDLDTYVTNPSGLGGGDITNYRMVWSIRVHTAYIGAEIDTPTITRLMDSVNTYLNTHKIIAVDSNWKIDIIRGGRDRQEFRESYTIGGELFVEVVKTVEHIPE